MSIGITWKTVAVGVDARFRGVSVAPAGDVWLSGTKGSVAVSRDGGLTWKAGAVPGAEGLDFRDIEAISESRAVLMAAGPGAASQVFVTANSGKSWARAKTPAIPGRFFDAIAFRDADRGLLLADPADGRWTLLVTEDSGSTWRTLPEDSRPKAIEGEGAFAASGTCLAVLGDGVWFATGGIGRPRVLHSSDFCRTWSVSEPPIAGGNASSGVFSIAFRDRLHGVATGGDYQKPDSATRIAAYTSDGGKTWTSVDHQGPQGYRSCVAFLAAAQLWVAVGPTGSDVSSDDGKTWAPIAGAPVLHSLASAGAGAIAWAGGDRGVCARLAPAE